MWYPVVEALLQFVAELLLELVLGGFLPGRRRRRRPRLTYEERLRRARARRRNRAIRRWLKKGDKRGAIPWVGLTCPQCGHSLGGLGDQKCIGCGSEFDLRMMIDHSVERP